MANEAIDLNKYIKIEVIIDDETSDSIESQTINNQFESDNTFVPNLSLAKSDHEHGDISEQTTALDEMNSSKTGLFNDSTKLSRIDRVTVNGNPYSEESLRPYENVSEAENVYFPSNVTQIFVSSSDTDVKTKNEYNELNPVVVLRRLCLSRIITGGIGEDKYVVSSEEYNGTVKLEPTDAAFAAYFCRRREDAIPPSMESNPQFPMREKSEQKEKACEKTFLCIQCLKRFGKPADLKQHMHWHFNRKFYICQHCNKPFPRLSDLKKHIVIHTEKRPYCCIVCGKAFRHLAHLREHQAVHSQERPFSCSECSATFKIRNALKSHQTTHMQILPFNCDHCGRCFSRKYKLRNHMTTHTKEKAFICVICDEAFRTTESLRKHRELHERQDAFVCNICYKAFRSNRLLRTHLKRHGAKTHMCIDCSRLFVCKKDLKEHILTHGGKRFICPICNNLYIRKNVLNIHMNVHTRQISYDCDECKKKFWVKHSLRLHILKNHLCTK